MKPNPPQAKHSVKISYISDPTSGIKEYLDLDHIEVIIDNKNISLSNAIYSLIAFLDKHDKD